MNGEMFASGEMMDDKITPRRRRIQSVRTRTGMNDPFKLDVLMSNISEASPSSSSTAPGDATNTGSEGKQFSSDHSTCFLVTRSNLAICWMEDREFKQRSGVG